MPATISLTDQDLYRAVSLFLVSIVGNTVPVVQGQDNRVPQPDVPYILLQAFTAGRVRTNVRTFNPDTQTQKTEQGTKVRMQMDCYGPDSESWATMISTLWRDSYGCDAMKPTCAPLYTGEPFQGALTNGEEQYESRWTVEGFLQYNPVTTSTMQSATSLGVSVVNADERYPP